MAEFTRDIKQLQQTASQQPSFAPPSQSLGGDIVNLVGTGLDFYAKNQAQKKLDGIEKMKLQEETAIDSSVLAYRDFRLEMGANNKKGGASYLMRDKEFLSNIPAQYRSQVVQRTNALTGRTTTQGISDSDKAMELAKTNREAQEVDALEKATSAGISVDPASLQGMSEDDLRDLQLKGIKYQAESTARFAQLSEEHKTAQTVTAKRGVESQGWLEMTNKDYTSKITVRAGTIIRNAGGVTEANTSEIIKQMQELKKNIANEVNSEFVRPARDRGLFISQDVINSAISASENGIDSYVNFITNKEGLEAIRTMTSSNVEGGILKMMASSVPEEARAAQMLSISKFIGLPTGIKNFDGYTKFVAGALVGSVSLADPKVKGLLVDGVSALSPLDPRTARDKFLETDSILESYLDGTPSAQKAVVSSGAYSKVVSTMAEEGSIIVDPASRELQADRMYKLSSKVLAATVQSINIQQSFKGPQEKLFTTNPNTFKLNTDNGQFKLVSPFPNAQPNTAVNQFNKLMADQIKAFEELGRDKEYIDRFKNDISISLSVFPTER
tara:strand:+ start:5668 stop:7335 length:1668 start_codon:yes stop_codon:yes gene_type:complete